MFNETAQLCAFGLSLASNRSRYLTASRTVTHSLDL